MKTMIPLCACAALLLALPAHAAPEACPPDDKACQRFQQMDADKDGKVSKKEFTAAMPNVNEKAFDMINTEKDEHLSLEEWRVFFAGHGKNAGQGKGMGQGMGMGQAMPPAGMGEAAPQAGTPLITPPSK
ncbi:MAG: EF-hand domain-containing protein [Desulfovibrionaceae bacterium]|nr:EF-hand domain-containing protein [Desulfovibrionaceae bacterium]